MISYYGLLEYKPGRVKSMSLTNVFSKLSTKKKIIVCAGAVAVIAAAVVGIVLARSGYIATTMRLLKIEGTVNLEDSKGGSKPVVDNIRFQSGDALSTGTDGLASVGLDNTKIITLQNDSRAEFMKKNKQLELKLTKGSVFFNVTEKLKSDEKFEIKTATMTAGIRGTSGMVYYDALDGGREALLITDGKVEVSATNPETGETKSAMVESGQSIKVYLFFDRQKDSVAFQIANVTLDNLPDAVAKRIAENDSLTRRVCDANDWDQSKLKRKGAVETKPASETTAATTAAPAQTTAAPETTESSKPAATAASSEATPTAGTSETPSETETTPTPTVTPTPTKKPSPTPTKKPTSKPTKATTAATTTEATTTESSETAPTTTKAPPALPSMPSGYKKYYVSRDSKTQEVDKYIAYDTYSNGDLCFAGYDTSKKTWIRLIRSAKKADGEQYEEFIGFKSKKLYFRRSGKNIFPEVKPGKTAGTNTPPSGCPSIPSGYCYYLAKTSSVKPYGTTSSAQDKIFICVKFVNSSGSAAVFKGYDNDSKSWKTLVRSITVGKDGSVNETFEWDDDNQEMYFKRSAKDLLMDKEK